MTDDTDDRKTERLARARAFLEAGRTQIDTSPPAVEAAPSAPGPDASAPGGTPRPDPTRFGDWEKNGRCIDF